MQSRNLRPAALLAGAVLALLPGAVAAQRPEGDTVPAYRIEALTVTARRSPTLANLLPQRVDVVTAAEIERSGARDVTELLKKTAGVDVVEYPGLLSGIGLRGFRPETGGIQDRTLVLVDGRPAGTDNLSLLDVASLERVEVVRGPVSALYGSSAMGGVVNLVTRRSTGRLGGQASVRYGSFQTVEATGRVGGSLGSRLDTDLSFTFFREGEDYRIGEGNLFRDLVGSDSATRLLGDGERQNVAEVGDGETRPFTEYGYASGRARLGLRLGGPWRADVRGELFRADDVQTPGDIFFGSDFALFKDLERRDAEVSLSAPEGRFSPLLRFFTSTATSDFYRGLEEERFVDFTGEVKSYGAQLQGTAARGAQSVVAGLDWSTAVEESRVFSAAGVRGAPYSPDASVGSAAAFAEGRFQALGGRLFGTLGGRVDRVSLELRETPLRTDVEAGEESFTVFNPSAGLRYFLAEGVSAHASAGRAFVSPTAFQKAGRVVQEGPAGVASFSVGNPELDAESSVTVDGGLSLSRPRAGIDADVTLFRTRVSDRITTAAAAFAPESRPTTPEGTPVAGVITSVNADRATMEGLEWRASYDLGSRFANRWSLRVFAAGNHLLRAEETSRFVSVDAARFAGRTDFRPEDAADALVFGDEGEREVLNVADHTLNYGVEWDDLRRFSARLSGRYVGERTDLDFTDFSSVANIRYPAFMVMDASAGVRLAERYRVSLLASNLTDENYYEKRGYNMPGRSLSLRLAVDF